MTKERAIALQEKFTEIIVAAKLNVSVGLKRRDDEWGIHLVSRQGDVQMDNSGPVTIQ